jgi:hypothetical protein
VTKQDNCSLTAETKKQIEQMREFTRRMSSSKEASKKFLASTRMHGANGSLKPAFR